MPRYKGQITAKMNERDFPHFVDIPIPGFGLGMRLNAMHDWLRERGIPSRQGGGGINVARWCFADQETADAFRKAFEEP